MLYGMFRLGIGFIIAIVLFVLIKYTKTIDKRKCCIAAFIAVSITVSLLYLIPFENAFITFSTPEKAFHYTNSLDIDNIVSGTETSFVIASKNNVNTYKIVPKTQKAGKLAVHWQQKICFSIFTTEYLFIYTDIKTLRIIISHCLILMAVKSI